MEYQIEQSQAHKPSMLLLKIEQYISRKKNSNSMEEKNTIEIVITAVVSVFGTIGLPKLWEHWFGHLSKKNESQSKQNKKIAELENKITRITTSVELLLIIIKHEFEGNPSIEQAFDRVNQHLHEDILQDGK